MKITMKQARVGINATQRYIAEKMDIHPQTYMKIEKNPGAATIDQACRFAKIVGLPVSDIFLNDESTTSRDTPDTPSSA